MVVGGRKGCSSGLSLRARLEGAVVDGQSMTTYADCHSLRCSSACFARRSARVMGASGSGWGGSSFAARSAWTSQSSSSQASGILAPFPIADENRNCVCSGIIAVRLAGKVFVKSW